MDIHQSITADRDRLDLANDRSGLVKTVSAAQDLDPSVAEQFEASLLEREGAILKPLAECGRPLDVALKECRPSQIEPFDDRLDALTAHRFPVREPALAQLGHVGLELAFAEPFAEELVIPAMESNAVVPDLSRKINRPVQML